MKTFNAEIKIAKESYWDILMIEIYFKKQIKEKKPIPSEILEKYFSLFSIKRSFQHQIDEMESMISKALSKRFASDKNYKFKYKIYSLEHLILFVEKHIKSNYAPIFQQTIKNPEERKVRLAFEIYKCIYVYREEKLDKDTRVFLSDYKLTVITSFVLNLLGIKVSSGANKKESNASLFDKGKYIVKKAIRKYGLPTVKEVIFPENEEFDDVIDVKPTKSKR